MHHVHSGLSAIGLDIGSRMIKAAQLKGRHDQRSLMALSMIPRVQPDLPLDRQEIDHLKTVLKRQGFRGQDVVLAVPEKQLLRGIFELPPAASGAPIEQIARMEVARMHHIEPHAFEMICWGPPPEQTRSTEAQTIAVAYPHQDANSLLDSVEACGLNVRALDARTAATARVCACLAVPAPGITAIIDLGWSSTKLLLVSGQTVLYERLLRSELGELAVKLSQRFGITPEATAQIFDSIGLAKKHQITDLDTATLEVIQGLLETHFNSMLEELTIPFDYVLRQYESQGVQRVLLTGGGANMPGLSEFMENALNLNVRQSTPADLLTSDPKLLTKARNPGLTVAVGLALFAEK